MSTILLPRKEGDLGQYFKDGSFIPWDEYDFEPEDYLDLCIIVMDPKWLNSGI